jgi:hypothetical protein
MLLHSYKKACLTSLIKKMFSGEIKAGTGFIRLSSLAIGITIVKPNSSQGYFPHFRQKNPLLHKALFFSLAVFRSEPERLWGHN